MTEPFMQYKVTDDKINLIVALCNEVGASKTKEEVLDFLSSKSTAQPVSVPEVVTVPEVISMTEVVPVIKTIKANGVRGHSLPVSKKYNWELLSNGKVHSVRIAKSKVAVFRQYMHKNNVGKGVKVKRDLSRPGFYTVQVFPELVRPDVSELNKTRRQDVSLMTQESPFVE